MNINPFYPKSDNQGKVVREHQIWNFVEPLDTSKLNPDPIEVLKPSSQYETIDHGSSQTQIESTPPSPNQQSSSHQKSNQSESQNLPTHGNTNLQSSQSTIQSMFPQLAIKDLHVYARKNGLGKDIEYSVPLQSSQESELNTISSENSPR